MCLICVCVCFYLFIIKSYKLSKNIFILLEGRETPSIPMHTNSFSLFFSPLLLHLSLLFFVSSKLIAWPSLSMVPENKTQVKFQRWEISWVLFSLLTCHFLIDFSNKSSSLIQEKKPCEISKRAVRCETFSWVMIKWKISLLVQFVFFFSSIAPSFFSFLLCVLKTHCSTLSLDGSRK